jgi:hypothetical protein
MRVGDPGPFRTSAGTDLDTPRRAAETPTDDLPVVAG